MDKIVNRTKKFSEDYQIVKCWVYITKDKLYVYQEQKPNTMQFYIKFFSMNHYFWNMIQQNCVQTQQGNNEKDLITIYNSRKLKQLIIKYMIKEWSFPYNIERNVDGSLTEETLQNFYKIHPRIIESLVDNYVYRSGFTDEEQGKIQKQCYLLFDKGQGISDPHWSVSLYCDLISFWQKFGLNYFDIQMLPQDIYDGLRKVMSSQIEINNSKMSANNNKQNKNGRQTKTIGF